MNLKGNDQKNKVDKTDEVSAADKARARAQGNASGAKDQPTTDSTNTSNDTSMPLPLKIALSPLLALRWLILGKRKQEDEKMTFGRFLKREVLPIGIFILLLLLFRSLLIDWNFVPSGSMRPTIIEGDRIAVYKSVYGLRVPFTMKYIAHWSEPKHGDIVVFDSPAEPGILLVKRVVAVPGDTIEVVDHKLILNGEPLEYIPVDIRELDKNAKIEQNYMDWYIEKLPGHEHLIAIPEPTQDNSQVKVRYFGPYVVKENEYFCMGDNRAHSNDSRAIGAIELKKIIGRSGGVIWSMDNLDITTLKTRRLFKRFDSLNEVTEELNDGHKVYPETDPKTPSLEGY